MVAQTSGGTKEIRGVKVRLVEVRVSGHVVEQILDYDVAEAEGIYGRPFDDEMDDYIGTGMGAIDRIAMDGTMARVASATSYVLDGKCVRTAKIDHCSDIQPMSVGWPITNSDGTVREPEPWSCVPGGPPISHKKLR